MKMPNDIQIDEKALKETQKIIYHLYEQGKNNERTQNEIKAGLRDKKVEGLLDKLWRK